MNLYAVTEENIVIAKSLTYREAIAKVNEIARNGGKAEVVISMPQMVIGKAAKKNYRY